tara:strand:- start:83 stop:346 length:264 start_codon:yes stop_codon:yes gene_type:complete
MAILPSKTYGDGIPFDWEGKIGLDCPDKTLNTSSDKMWAFSDEKKIEVFISLTPLFFYSIGKSYRNTFANRREIEYSHLVCSSIGKN